MLSAKSALHLLLRGGSTACVRKPGIATLTTTSTTQPPSTNTLQSHDKSPSAATPPPDQPQKLKKTLAELDADSVAQMRQALGDRHEGGVAGIEYEDGQPVTMKRGVRENMFRYI